MQLTRQTDYAVRAVLHLATHPLASIREIADEQCVPHVYLAKIVQKLAQAGIVATHRGAGGGISLAIPPEKISLLRVIEAIEGPLALNLCFARPGECPRESYCAAHEELEEIQKKLAAMFSRIDFARLARKEAARRDHAGSRPQGANFA
ncbi:MAG: Rrf2 family transcriptional regulator [Thermoleophilia bacterium]|nr:Rrf2 family transcriptional regulator [Thermoleophilia bacterium]